MGEKSTAERPSSNRRPGRVVVIAASAGGPNALLDLVGQLDAAFPLPIVVIQHLQPGRPSMLAGLLARRSTLPVSEAKDGESLQPGHLYLAPPDRHLSIQPGPILRLTESPKIHFLRPAADILFQSAADVFDGDVIAVVLTGSGTDGAAGAHAIRKSGGRVIVQDQASSEFFGMPSAVIAGGDADAVVPLREIGHCLAAMTAEV